MDFRQRIQAAKEFRDILILSSSKETDIRFLLEKYLLYLNFKKGSVEWLLICPLNMNIAAYNRAIEETFRYLTQKKYDAQLRECVVDEKLIDDFKSKCRLA